jgi:hypothetical protein
MDTVIGSILFGSLFLLGLFAFLVFDQMNNRCSNCGTRSPIIYGLWGGWTCSKCGLKLDRNGEPK